MLARPTRTALWFLLGILLTAPLLAQQYAPKTITFTGDAHDTPAAQIRAVAQYWKLKPGDVFDATYPSRFLLLNKKTLPQLDGWSATYKQYDNTVTHIVYLTLKFNKGGLLK